MKHKSFSTQYTVIESIDELEDSERSLCYAALSALQTSYARYSGYRVGAAVLMDDGAITQGANQENAVYPLGLCAERVAMYSAASATAERKMKAVAVTTEKRSTDENVPAFPCGSCRQVMVEMERRYDCKITIYIFGPGTPVYKVNSARDILPFAFDDRHLE